MSLQFLLFFSPSLAVFLPDLGRRLSFSSSHTVPLEPPDPPDLPNQGSNIGSKSLLFLDLGSHMSLQVSESGSLMVSLVSSGDIFLTLVRSITAVCRLFYESFTAGIMGFVYFSLWHIERKMLVNFVFSSESGSIGYLLPYFILHGVFSQTKFSICVKWSHGSRLISISRIFLPILCFICPHLKIL